MNDWKQELHDRLTEAFVGYQFRLENPMPEPTETEDLMLIKYRTDPIFRNKVESIVCGVMRIVIDVLDKTNDHTSEPNT